jgi:hypothetical protein
MTRAPLASALPTTPLLLLAPLLLALQACCNEEPREALPTAPDRECKTGVEVGFDIAVWECVNDEHVVAFRESSAFTGCSGVTVQRAPCGQITPFERENSRGTQPICDSP